MAFTPKQQNWRWYQNNAAEPTVALAAENTAPSVLVTDNSIIRLRVTIAETGGTAGSNKAIVIQYSTDETNWTSLGSTAVWNYANGAATGGNTIAGILLSDGAVKGKYHENGSTTESWGISEALEMDIAIVPVAGTKPLGIYYFRVLQNYSTEVPLNSGETHPSVTLAVNTGINVPKAVAYSVLSQPIANISASKAVAYAALIDISESINVSKAVAYAVLSESTAEPPYDDGTPSGGIVFGGEVVEVGTWIIGDVVGSGGAVVGGAVSTSTTRIESGIGGIVGGGSAQIQVLLITTAAGGAVTGGSPLTESILLQLVSITTDGGCVTGGDPSKLKINTLSVDGGLVAGGEVVEEWIDALPDNTELDFDNIRQFFTAKKTGDHIRLLLTGSVVKPVTITGMSIQLRSGTTEDYTTTPYRFLFGDDSESVTVPAGGSVYTNWLEMPVVKGSVYLYHIAFLKGTNWVAIRPTTTPVEYDKLAGTNDTMVVDVSDYTMSRRRTMVNSVSIYAVRIRTMIARRGGICGGRPSWAKTKIIIPRKGAVVGGRAAVKTLVAPNVFYTTTGLGGAEAGGEPTPVYLLAGITAAGGTVAGGQPDIWFTLAGLHGSGGAVKGGAATYLRNAVYIVSGGAVEGGTASTINIAVYPSAGGAVSGGTTLPVNIFTPLSIGGLVSGGVDSVNYIRQITISGGAVSGGLIVPGKITTLSVDGGAVVGGQFTLYTHGGFVFEGGIIEFTGYIPRIKFVGSKAIIQFELKEPKLVIK